MSDGIDFKGFNMDLEHNQQENLQQAYEEIKEAYEQLQENQLRLEEYAEENEAQLEEIMAAKEELEQANKKIEEANKKTISQQDSVLIELQRSMKSGIWRVDIDADRKLVGVQYSKEYREILGLQDKNVFPDTLDAWLSRIHPEDKEATRESYLAMVNDLTGNVVYDDMHRFMDGKGQYRWLKVVGRLVRHEDGSSTIIGFATDETDKLYFDPITGGINRSGFEYYLNNFFKNQKLQNCYSVLYINIRNFKALNDLWGFDEGDRFLKHYYQLLKQSSLQPLEVGRRGDHFICLVKWDDSLFNEIEKLCTVRYTVQNSVIFMHMRCGIYHVVDYRLNGAGMLDRAKLAKEKITDEFVKPYEVYDEQSKQHYVEIAFASAEIETALEQKQFKVFYQPIVDAQSGKIVSAEALVRWQHPERGMINPGAFIPAMEKSGFISAVDRYVIEQIHNLYNARLNGDLPLVPVSVNLSWMDFYDQKLLQWLFDGLDKSYHPEGLLRAEVTESSYAALSQNITNILNEFSKKGVTLLLDDFGTGVSSLAMLQEYTFDILKIDMSFTRKIGINPKTSSLLQAVIDMCHQMGIKVVAEGVETIEQYDFYKENQCDYIQGYYFFKPMCEEDFIALLDQQAAHNALEDFRRSKEILPSSYYKAYLYFPTEEIRQRCNLAADSILQMIGANSGVGAVSGLYDESCSICFFSNLTAEFLGYTNEELLKVAQGSYLNLVAPDDRERFCNDEAMERYYGLISKGGRTVYVKEMRTNVRTAKGEKQWVASLKKIEKLSSEEMLRIAQISRVDDLDSFTHLLSKNNFFRRLDTMLKNDPELPCTLMILDLDNFKSVNDQCGHMQGDAVLLKVVDIIKKTFRGNDMIGRFGGDEFMVLMDGVNDKALAEKRATRLLEIISHEIYYPKLRRSCTLSIGIKCSEGTSTRSQLFNSADAALYRAKAEGKNTYRMGD